MGRLFFVHFVWLPRVSSSQYSSCEYSHNMNKECSSALVCLLEHAHRLCVWNHSLLVHPVTRCRPSHGALNNGRGRWAQQALCRRCGQQVGRCLGRDEVGAAAAVAHVVDDARVVGRPAGGCGGEAGGARAPDLIAVAVHPSACTDTQDIVSPYADKAAQILFHIC